MTKRIIFIHGAGAGAYDEDEKLARKLQSRTGSGYNVTYLRLPDENNAPYDEWRNMIEQEENINTNPVILVGHSIGGSHLAKMQDDPSPMSYPL